MSVLLIHGNRSEREHEETISVCTAWCTEEVVPLYTEIDEKKRK
jgi:hypothetical protein